MTVRRYFAASRDGLGAATPRARDDNPAVVDAAIARVLAAEAWAREDVEAAAREAQALLDDARERVRSIGERAERRIRAACGRQQQAVERAVARIEAQAAAVVAEHALTTEDHARLARAAAAVAADLTQGP